MTWQAIAEGAKGIVFYCFHGMFKFADEATRAKLWGDVVDVTRDVKRFENVLLSVEPAPMPVGAPPSLSVRTWRLGDEVYLLAVNTKREPLSAEIGLSACNGCPSCRCVDVPAELGGGVSVLSAGRIRVELPPIGVSLVRIR